jgi:hypothetical protein
MENIGQIIQTYDPEISISHGIETKSQAFVIIFNDDENESFVYVHGYGSKFNFDLLKVGYFVSIKFIIQSIKLNHGWETSIVAEEIKFIREPNRPYF